MNLTSAEQFMERCAKAMEDCADVLQRSEKLLERALAVRDGIKPTPVQPCALENYGSDDHQGKLVCDLPINHRGSHHSAGASGDIFWRRRAYGSEAYCAVQEPQRGGIGIVLCSQPAGHAGRHMFEEYMP